MRWWLAGALCFFAWTEVGSAEGHTPTPTPPRPAAARAPDVHPGTLASAAARRGLTVGVAVRQDALDDRGYAAAVAAHFTAITPENALKLHDRWSPDGFHWAEADAIADLARRNGQGLRLHPLVWDHPDGRLPGMEAMRPAACQDALRRHIDAAIARYADVLVGIDVVNEPLNARGKVAMGRWTACLGADPIPFAFAAAAAARAAVGVRAPLAINEYDALVPNPKSDGLFALVTDLRARGVPVESVGLQAHVLLSAPPDPAKLRANLRRFADAGLSVEITELDVALDVPGLSPAAALDRQARVAADIVAACVELGAACRGVTVWGVSDDVSWRVREVPGSRDAPVLLDAERRPKAAYQRVLGVLEGTAVAAVPGGRRTVR